MATCATSNNGLLLETMALPSLRVPSTQMPTSADEPGARVRRPAHDLQRIFAADIHGTHGELVRVRVLLARHAPPDDDVVEVCGEALESHVGGEVRDRDAERCVEPAPRSASS